MLTFEQIFSSEHTDYLKAILDTINKFLLFGVKKAFLEDFNGHVNKRFAFLKGKPVEVVAVTPEHTKMVLLHHVAYKKQKGESVHVEFFSTVAGDALEFIP